MIACRTQKLISEWLISKNLIRKNGKSSVKYSVLVSGICAHEGVPIPHKKRWESFLNTYARDHGAEMRKSLPFDPELEKKKKKADPISGGKDFYHSRGWLSVRYFALKAANGDCECCEATAKSSGRPLHVDHIKPRSIFLHLELDRNNLQVLCHDCNMGKSNKDDTDWRGHGATVIDIEELRRIRENGF